MSKLRIVQIYIGTTQIRPPECSVSGCSNRSRFLVTNDEHEGFDLCFKHIEADIKDEQIEDTFAYDNYAELCKKDKVCKERWAGYKPKGVAANASR